MSSRAYTCPLRSTYTGLRSVSLRGQLLPFIQVSIWRSGQIRRTIRRARVPVHLTNQVLRVKTRHILDQKLHKCPPDSPCQARSWLRDSSYTKSKARGSWVRLMRIKNWIRLVPLGTMWMIIASRRWPHKLIINPSLKWRFKSKLMGLMLTLIEIRQTDTISLDEAPYPRYRVLKLLAILCSTNISRILRHALTFSRAHRVCNSRFLKSTLEGILRCQPSASDRHTSKKPSYTSLRWLTQHMPRVSSS